LFLAEEGDVGRKQNTSCKKSCPRLRYISSQKLEIFLFFLVLLRHMRDDETGLFREQMDFADGFIS